MLYVDEPTENQSQIPNDSNMLIDDPNRNVQFAKPEKYRNLKSIYDG